MFSQIKKYAVGALVALVVIGQMTACNKIPEVEDIVTNPPAGQTIADQVNGKPEYSLLKLAATKAGLILPSRFLQG